MVGGRVSTSSRYLRGAAGCAYRGSTVGIESASAAVGSSVVQGVRGTCR